MPPDQTFHGPFLVKVVDVNGQLASSATTECVIVISAPAATPSLSLTKTADKPAVPFGGSVTYTYVVKNTGNVTLTNVKVVDDNGTPTFTGDDFEVGTLASLAPGASTTFSKTVVPLPRAIPPRSARTWSWPAGSRPSVGSSKNTTAGSLSSARAMPRRWRMPRL